MLWEDQKGAVQCFRAEHKEYLSVEVKNFRNQNCMTN